ncbi:hypothetical protein VN23_08435 [Janthinobacterium sp. B9-8]|nr:hypothetical protein VN23_08435 [Janthinobacterium sp. B9-8]
MLWINLRKIKSKPLWKSGLALFLSLSNRLKQIKQWIESAFDQPWQYDLLFCSDLLIYYKVAYSF